MASHAYSVYGVDKRANTWTREFDTLHQDLAGSYPALARLRRAMDTRGPLCVTVGLLGHVPHGRALTREHAYSSTLTGARNIE